MLDYPLKDVKPFFFTLTEEIGRYARSLGTNVSPEAWKLLNTRYIVPVHEAQRTGHCSNNLIKFMMPYYDKFMNRKDKSLTQKDIIPVFARYIVDKYVKSHPAINPLKDYPEWIVEIINSLDQDFVNDTKWRMIVKDPFKNRMVYLNDDPWDYRMIDEFQSDYHLKDKFRDDYVYVFITSKHYFVRKDSLSEDIFVFNGLKRYELINRLSNGSDSMLKKYVQVFLKQPANAEHILYLYNNDGGNYKWYKQWFDTESFKLDSNNK